MSTRFARGLRAAAAVAVVVLAVAAMAAGCRDWAQFEAPDDAGAADAPAALDVARDGPTAADAPAMDTPVVADVAPVAPDVPCGAAGQACCPAGRAAVCAAGLGCLSGTCQACMAPSELCAAACVDTNADSDNCGRCGRACPGRQTCQGGRCRP